MAESHEKIVNFELCKFCKYWGCPESAEPCSECLDNSTNVDSQRPIYFKDTGELEKILQKEIIKENNDANLH